MTAVKVEFMLPAEVVSKLGDDKKSVSQELKKAGVIDLFRKGRISSGKAAEVLGMTKLNFLDMLSYEKVPYYNKSSEQLEKEYKTARKSTKKVR